MLSSVRGAEKQVETRSSARFFVDSGGDLDSAGDSDPWYLVMEDDVVFCPGWHERMQRELPMAPADAEESSAPTQSEPRALRDSQSLLTGDQALLFRALA